MLIQDGLDPALNIDRESFNFSHPHVQLVTGWLHRAIRQLTNKQKEISQNVRDARKVQDVLTATGALKERADFIWTRLRGTQVPDVRIASSEAEAQTLRSSGYISISSQSIPSLSEVKKSEIASRTVKAEALLKVLDAFNILDDRPYDEQKRLLQAILEIFYEDSER